MSNNPLSRNPIRQPNISLPIRQPNSSLPLRQQMEQEYSPALIFQPIQKESPDNKLKQQMIELQLSIKAFSKKIVEFDFEDKLEQLKQSIQIIENCIEKDQSIDWEQLKSHLIWLKDQYLIRQNTFKEHLKNICSFSNTEAGDIVKFLRKISANSFEISYQECQSLLFLQQELSSLEIFTCVLRPKVQQYKEILYYEKIDPPIIKYTKNQVPNSFSIIKNDLYTLIDLLNKYYKFGALPKPQERYVQFMNQSPEMNYGNLQYSKVLILILEIPLENNMCTYALLQISQQQNQRVCKSISIGKMRSQLHELSKKFDCTTFTPTLVAEFKLETVFLELLKVVAPQINIKNLIQFLQENDYLLREDKNKSQGYVGNYIIDVFEMERLGFLLE